MNNHGAPIIFVLLIIVTIVAMDFLFLRHRTGLRLAANIAVVVIYLAIYLLFFRH